MQLKVYQIFISSPRGFVAYKLQRVDYSIYYC